MRIFPRIVSQFLYTVLTAMIFISSGCGSDELVNPPNPNEQELTTTLILSLKDSSSGEQFSFIFDDPDGEGGNPPTTFDTINVGAGKTYFAETILLNKSVTPVDTLTNEVLEEGTEHQFFYITNGVSTVISYNDSDANGNPIGLKTIWQNGAVSNGRILVILKHQPGIKAPAPGDPNIGETDVQIDFAARVQ